MIITAIDRPVVIFRRIHVKDITFYYEYNK